MQDAQGSVWTELGHCLWGRSGTAPMELQAVGRFGGVGMGEPVWSFRFLKLKSHSPQLKMKGWEKSWQFKERQEGLK